MDTIYKCPVCGHGLKGSEGILLCDKGHSYDLSAEGYVNLILANQKRTQDPGDSKAMVENRRRFLELGFYDRLSDKIDELVIGFIKGSASRDRDFNIVDLGCGEGYYTQRLQVFLENGSLKSRFRLWGVDVSKSAIQKAARRSQAIRFCVGNNYRLPYLDESVDIAFSVFSPLEPKELMRVLRPGGKVIVVRPGADHLRELAALLYDKFERQGDSSGLPESLNRQPLESGHVEYKIHLRSNEAILSLIGMTPYFWSMGEDKKALLAKRSELEATVDFQWSVFQG